MKNKIIKKEDYPELRKKFKEENKTVALCHGVYDLIHPGHILHLQQANEKADILVVSITSAPYMQKGPDRPYFNDDLRLMSLASLEMVDYVILSEETTAIGIIDAVQPDFYVKGSEYATYEDDVTGNIDAEVYEVRKFGGDIYYTTGDTFSSTKLINTAFSAIRPEVAAAAKKIKKNYDLKYLQTELEKLTDLKILVVGDVIIDEYINCEPQGLMSKDQVISTRYLETNRYLGGSLAIANHLAGFSNNVTMCAMVGDEAETHSIILNSLGGKMFLDLDFNKDYETILKRKYITKQGVREEYRKLFAINYLPDAKQQESINKQLFYDKLKNNLRLCDMVVVCDYGHGLIDDTALDIIYRSGKYMSVNCQTNSSNYGMNLITKYEKADHFTLDEREMKLALKDEKTDHTILTAKLKKMLKADYAFLTLGSKGAIGIGADDTAFLCPALVLSVKDTIGAGDAFYAMSALCACIDMPIEPATLLGNAAGAIIANVISNSEAINRARVLKFVSTVLNV